MKESESERVVKKQARTFGVEKRIEMAHSMIGKMCAEGRPPKMSIPVQGTDEDVFITVLLSDLREMIRPLQKLLSDKGRLVSTGSLSADEIAFARAEGRLYVNADSFGWVWFADN